MNNYNILYFSNKCQASHQLLAMFDREKLTTFFYKICVDNNPNIPKQIRVTPTFIIRGVPFLYEGATAFAWLNKVKQYKYCMMMQQMGQKQQQYLQNMIGNTTSGSDMSVLGFSQTEMNGMSDIFSFFSKNIEQECQDALPQTFVPCKDIAKYEIFTPPLENGKYKIDKSSKIDPKKQKELELNLEAQRKKQDLLFKQSIDSFKNSTFDD
ncbi:hypothetical protein [Acanthamoeba castellanii mimivirus]|jgi:hypothetical protein|uniref:Uncharacterized protein L461 n=6 Tax=Mimivirus TaxID=315393 RepID=YL461_MIMIV|nr:hypothetical protein MIMI_gp0495 [Acanthamoeba polyphaga mimivirus]Q5UQC8.1 RecName: Full=Uncharacterized protein L461 [Acanthamoeba polyphaga mimivirus]AEQ60648.1 hypothetical protein [Acanthamoeba castellanii mamavirus]AHA45398.1 hypothetical protein HIRU_S492 [Hirudovirus strain Sangsue]ALR84051.1 hypothetical protein [Niemeyer virus]AMZ02905.1 hypothetical protein [Mimivirus Bombay]EJN40896.1 hypothetical protein lvs_L392 [Acanthamoeba polyphaga lentillevirus]QTF49376.1 hypothetical p